MLLQGTAYAGTYVFNDTKYSSSPSENYGMKFYKGTVNGMPPVITWTLVGTDFYQLAYSNPQYPIYGYNVNFQYTPANGIPHAATKVEVWDLTYDIKLYETSATWVP